MARESQNHGLPVVMRAFILAICLKVSCTFMLDNSLLSAMDETRGALLSMRAQQPIVIERFTKVVPNEILPVKKVGGASLSRRRRISTSALRPIAPPRKITTVKKYTATVNKYLLAINQIEKAIMEAGAMMQSRFIRNKVAKLQQLKSTIKKACDNKQYILARQLVGHAVYLASQVPTQSRGRRQAGSGSTSIITDIKGILGDDQFSKLLALDGGVTLSFAVDTTGSMRNEIDATISIATDIINHPRTYLVDYILSPFNDPITANGHGPLVYRPPEEKQQFIDTNLKSLTARGGGDCDELAITGIQEIYSSSVMEFSPIYVFTDAGAKDASVDNLDTLLTSALAFSTPINFFLSLRGCLKEKHIQVYRNLALETGGEVLIFGKGGIKEMSAYIRNALAGGSVIPVDVGTNTITLSRKKRAAKTSRHDYVVQVDDTVEKLTASVSTEKDTSDVILLDPHGRKAGGTISKLKRGAVFVVIAPSSGKWKISVTASAGKHNVNCRAVSKENIDFSYEFLVGIKTRGKIKPIASATPITGKTATVIITLSGYANVLPGTLVLETLDENKRTIGASSSLQPYGTSRERFMATFKVTGSIKLYYLAVKGKTKTGLEFRRMSPKPVKPQTIVIQTLMARNGYTIQAGSRLGTTILLAIRNLGANEVFSITVVDSKGYLTSRSNRDVLVIKDRSSLLPLKFKAPASAKRGSSYTVQVIVRGKTSNGKQLKAIMMMIV